MGKKKDKQIQVVMHQHQDEFGRVFGGKHPLDAEHKKAETQKFHDITVKNT
jgi:cytochrome c556